MCSRVTCPTCGKPDWAGCGAHVEIVLRDVPRERRCRCREDGTRKPAPGLASWIHSWLGGGR